MGNALSQNPADLDSRRVSYAYKSELKICLLCHEDDYENRDWYPPKYTGDLKRIIRNFAHELYETDASTITLWSTWDKLSDMADIVRRVEVPHVVPNARSVFDIIVFTYCMFGHHEEDVEDVHRLLKPGGFIMIIPYGYYGPDWHSQLQEKYNALGKIPLTHEQYALVPVFIVEEEPHPFVLLQKLKISTRPNGERYYERVT